MQDCNDKKRVRDDSDESELDSPEAKRIRDDLLDISDDSDATIQDLESVIKSFEAEILLPAKAPPPTHFPGPDSAECHTYLGYLLEASDDELGLPPTFSTQLDENKSIGTDSAGICSEADGAGEVGFDAEIPHHELLGFGIYNDSGFNGDSNVEFGTLGGLFDYSAEIFEPSDFSGLLWGPASVAAV